MKTMRLLLMILAIGLVLVSGTQNLARAEAHAEVPKLDGLFDKGFKFQTDDGINTLQLKARIQLRYANSMREGAGNDQQSFMARRIYLTSTGTFFDKDLSYLVTLNANPGAVASDVLHDSWINYRFADPAQILFGKHKLSFNRQEINSDGKLQFVDRSLASSRFGLDRSIGLLFHGKGFDKKLEYYLTVANGRSTRTTINGNQELAYIARVAYNPMGELGYSEGDTDDTQKPLLSIGAAATYYQEEPAVSAAQDDVMMGNADVAFKYRGFSFVGEFFYRQTDPGAAAKVKDAGYYAQAGYFIVPKKFEIALRASSLFDDLGNNGGGVYFSNGSLTGLGGVNDGVDEVGDSQNEHEFSSVFSYYFKGHNLKLQGQYTFMLDNQAGGTLNNHIAMLQTQLEF